MLIELANKTTCRIRQIQFSTNQDPPTCEKENNLSISIYSAESNFNEQPILFRAVVIILSSKAPKDDDWDARAWLIVSPSPALSPH